ncbi:hypothetical protein BGX21_011525 [Mortierella sp. AD011]|nr:hypothetical protein BGX20_002384 [Mortierella sp. AD010]KAF9390218.1 hypothetical protein BGX21_011525 [Mortierella sp. AD011]
MPTPRQESASADDNGRQQTENLVRSRRRRFSSPSNTEALSPPPKRKRTSNESESGEPQSGRPTPAQIGLSQVPQVPGTAPYPPTSSSMPELGSENGGPSSTPTPRVVERRASKSRRNHNNPILLHDTDSDLSDASGISEDHHEDGNGDDSFQLDSEHEHEQHEQEQPTQTTHDAASTTKPKRRRPRLYRGNYRPRSMKGWGAFFRDQNPTVTKDGIVMVDDEYDETRAYLRDKWHRSFSFLKSSEVREGLLSEISAPVGPEVSDVETEASEKKKEAKREKVDDSVAFIQAANKKLRQELEDWAVDPPDMQYPYLQSAFPYEDYEPPANRIDNSSYGSLPQPLPLDWYRPQGPTFGEDFFTMEKYKYASKMLRSVEVETENLRMDVYYHRGFELASRKVLDRARSELRKAKKSRINSNSDEENPSSATETQSQSNGVRMDSTGDALSSRQSLAERNTGQNTNIPTTNGLNDPMELADTPSVADTDPSTTRADEINESSPTSELNSKDSTDRTPGSPIERNGIGATPERVTLNDYYLANKFLSSIFVLGDPATDIETILSPGARRILQTMLSGLETKILGMGCHLQRIELTKRLSDIDLKRTSNMVVERMKRKLQRLEQTAYELASYELAASEQADERSADASENTTMEIEEASQSRPDMPPPPRPTKQRGRYSRNTLPAYYRLKKVDMDDYVTKKTPPGRPRKNSYQADSRPLSPSPAPSLDQSSVPSSVCASFAATPSYCSFTRSASVSTTTSFFTEMDDTQSMTESDFQDDVTSQYTPKPFISNPLGIPDTMDPFYIARNYLEKLHPLPEPSPRPPAPAPASHPRSDSVPSEEPAEIPRATTPVAQESPAPLESTVMSVVTARATLESQGSVESTAASEATTRVTSRPRRLEELAIVSEAMDKAASSLQRSVAPLSRIATAAIRTSRPRVDPIPPTEPTTATTTVTTTTTTTTIPTTPQATKVTHHPDGPIAALLEAARLQSIRSQESNSTSVRTGSGLSWAPIKPRTRLDGEETDSE